MKHREKARSLEIKYVHGKSLNHSANRFQGFGLDDNYREFENGYEYSKKAVASAERHEGRKATSDQLMALSCKFTALAQRWKDNGSSSQDVAYANGEASYLAFLARSRSGGVHK